MKKVLLSVLGMITIIAAGFSQKGNNQVGVAAEFAVPTGDAGETSKLGVGATVKGLYGIGEAGQITFTTGLLVAGTKNEFKDLLDADKITSTMIPLLAGYRHHFKNFYAEPQIGYGIYGVKVKGGDYASKDSEGAFTWAINGGYTFNNFEAGIRFQNMHKNGESSGFFGVRLGYNFSLTGLK